MVGTLVRKLVAAGAAAGAAVAARRAVELGWTMVRGQEPPTAADVVSDTELRDLLLWSAVVIGAVAVARSVAAGAAVSLLSPKDDEDED
jgi:hypothetical protein